MLDDLDDPLRPRGPLSRCDPRPLNRDSSAVTVGTMTRAIFEPEHEAFRETVGTFLDKEAVPFHEQWEKDGIVDREVWAKAGAQGLLGAPARPRSTAAAARPTSATTSCSTRR